MEKIQIHKTAEVLTKKIGKGKETVEHKREIPYSDIKEAIVTIIFN